MQFHSRKKSTRARQTVLAVGAGFAEISQDRVSVLTDMAVEEQP